MVGRSHTSAKFCIISRDGKAVNDFLEQNNLFKENVTIIKHALELSRVADGSKYIILPPLPLTYQWAFRPILLKKNMINITKFYNNKLKNF